MVAGFRPGRYCRPTHFKEHGLAVCWLSTAGLAGLCQDSMKSIADLWLKLYSLDGF